MMPAVRIVLSAIVLSQTCVGCLPDSGRPPPGEATLFVSPGDALTGGVMTADGWSITFDRLLVAGFADLWGGGSCIVYSNRDYLRVVDAARAGEHKVATVFGLNECTVVFQLTPPPPSEDVVPGDGVTGDDVTELTNSGASLQIVGRASQGERRLSFDWSIGRTSSHPACSPTELRASESSTVTIQVEAQLLFDGTEQQFEPLAAMDLDADSDITLDEVSSNELLAEQLRKGAHQLLRYEGQSCEADASK